MAETVKRLIQKMPDRQTLEAFVKGLEGGVTVIFNLEKGEFEWVTPRPDPRLGEPITDEGWRIRRL